jgi:predicted DNA-binding transcriptional regulator AlpA
MSITPIDPLAMLRFKDIKEEYQIAKDRKTIKTWMGRKDDPFPPAYELSKRSIAWKRSDVEDWIARQKKK